jgi:hypothetical protein
MADLIHYWNWTSTQVPMWQIDCDTFRKAGSQWELRDVKTEEHEKFLEFFTALHELTFTRHGTSARFEAPAVNRSNRQSLPSSSGDPKSPPSSPG